MRLDLSGFPFFGFVLGCGGVFSIRLSTSSRRSAVGSGVGMAIILMRDPDWWGCPSLYEEYWMALGRFVHRYATLEQEIHHTLKMFSETSDEVAQAVFSGTRAKGAWEFIDRIREAKGRTKNDDYKRSSDHFGLITSVRDALMHQGALLHGEGFRTSNEHRTIHRSRRIIPVSPDDLAAMTADLDVIFATIFEMQCEADGTDITKYKTDLPALGRSAWRYKSRARVAPRQKSAFQNQEYGDQPPPSEG